MKTFRLIPVLLLSIVPVLFGQATANTPFSEYFGGSNAQWTLTSGDSGTSMSYNSTSAPGLNFSNTSTGLAYAPWTINASQFFFSFRASFSNAGWSRADGTSNGQAIGLTTAVPGSMVSSDSSITFLYTPQGITASMRSGELSLLAGSLLYSNTCTWPWISTDSSIPTNWNWWFTISRDGTNNLAWSVFTDQYQSGQSPMCTSAFTIPTGHQADQYKYVDVLDLTAVAFTKTQVTGIANDFYGYTTITGGSASSVSSVIPSGPSITIQSGSTATITGANFDNSSPYNLTVGNGSTLQTATPAFVSSTSMTVTLPTESNSALPYHFHLLRNGIDAALQPGIVYSAPILNYIVPHEVPVTPANSADGTVQFYGQGLTNCSVTFNGASGAVTPVTPLQISVVVPAGTAGLPHIVVTCNSSTVYDSATSGTYPPQGKISFGYAAHPYLQFTNGTPTANSPTLASIQAQVTNPAFANYVEPLNRNIATPPTPSAECSPTTCWTASQQQNWFDYGFHCLFFQDSPSCATYQTLVAPQLAAINWYSGGASFNLSPAQNACLLYDAFFPSLTPAQRAQYLSMIDSISAYYYFSYSTNDSNTNVTGSTFDNRIAMANSSAGVCVLSESFSLASITGYTTSAPWLSIAPATEIAKAINNLVSNVSSYGNNEWMADGGCVEGPNYCHYGGVQYTIFGRSLINTNLALGNGLGDQGMFETNFQHNRNYYRAMWDGVQWMTFNDTQPEFYAIPVLVDSCIRFSEPDLCGMADNLGNIIANADDGYIDHLNFQPSGGQLYAPYAFMWRGSTVATFSPFDPISTLANVSYATIRSGTNWNPNFVIGLKGCSANECGTTQHFEPDQASIDIQAFGDELLGDLGYYASANNQHSRISVAGSFGLPGGTASIDKTAQVNTGAWRCTTVDGSATYTTVATVLRRNVCMYVNGSSLIALSLDDVQPSGSAATVGYWQAVRPISSVSASGFTVNGNAAKLSVKIFGPASTAATPAANLNCGITPQPWVDCELQVAGFNFNTVTDSYIASTSQPRITSFAPYLIGGSPITMSVSYGSGTLTATVSDGSTITFVNGSGLWLVSGTTTAGKTASQ